MRAVRSHGEPRRPDAGPGKDPGDGFGSAAPWTRQLRDAMRRDSAVWRRMMVAGIKFGPEPLVRYSPFLLGWAFSAALAPQRRSVRKTLRMIHGVRPSSIEALDIARVFANFAASMTDAILVGTGRDYEATSHPVNEHYMLDTLKTGAGIIVATAQTAGWDVGGTLLHADLDREVLVVMEREADATARELHDANRNRAGVRVIHVGNDPLASLPLLKHLKRGGIVALKIDRIHPGMRTVPATLFGKPWEIPMGPLHLASLTGATIVQTLTRRMGFLEYEPIVYPPFQVPHRATPEQFGHAAQQLANNLESFAREHPTHWIRFHDATDGNGVS